MFHSTIIENNQPENSSFLSLMKKNSKHSKVKAILQNEIYYSEITGKNPPQFELNHTTRNKEEFIRETVKHEESYNAFL